MINLKNKKFAMVIAELILALIICGIIFVISIQVFRSTDVTKTPYIYSFMKNLPAANEVIMDDCYLEGRCQSKNQLPENPYEYCAKLAYYFNTSGAVLCSNNRYSLDVIKNEKHYNFKLPNGISVYGLSDNDKWQSKDSSASNKYIDILIDINGEHGKNENREDIFPVRIFRNGDVVPGIYKDQTDDFLYENPNFFGYRVLLNQNQNNSTTTTVADIRTSDEIGNGAKFKNDPISFKEALCKAYGADMAEDMLERYYGRSINCDDNDTAQHCLDEGNYCTVEAVKPKSSGLVRMLGL